MIGYRNPIALLREVTAQIRGVKKTESWGIYLTVAFLCLTMACLLAVNVALHPASKETAVRGQQHMELRLKEKLVPVNTHVQPEMEKAVTANTPTQSPKAKAPSAPQQTAKAEKQETEAGVWYYDEVHKDWRYKKARG